MSSSYTAVVTKITTRPHPNADRLLLGACLGNQVVIGKDTTDGDLGVFFPTDGEVSHEFCMANNLYNKSALQKLELLKDQTEFGFFDYKRRVRSQSFRGAKSDGFWVPLTFLAWAGDTATLKEGDTFTEFGGYEICKKYYTPATLRAMKQGQVKKRREVKTFPKHDVTKQFRFVADQIPDDSVIYITEKLHGTSGRYGYVLDEEPVTGWRRMVNTYLLRRGYFQPTPAYVTLNGSKNVILERVDQRKSFYGTDDFRYAATQDIELRKGEIIYFEIVGWVSETTPIMPPHKADKQTLGEVRAKYGDTINYNYGCPAGVSRIYVYKIALTNEDGIETELSWPQVVARCTELGLAHVPLLLGPATLNSLAHIHQCDGKEALRKTVELLTEGESTLDHTQIREGVVIRTESSLGISHIKNKSFAFGVMEGYIKEQETYVDLEEVS